MKLVVGLQVPIGFKVRGVDKKTYPSEVVSTKFESNMT